MRRAKIVVIIGSASREPETRVRITVGRPSGKPRTTSLVQIRVL
jgi:hypothetical protein